MLNEIFKSGLIVALPPMLPLQSITKVSDALLASPIVAVVVAWRDGVEPLLFDLRKRSGGHLAVGVSGVTTAVFPHAHPYIHFAISPTFDHELQKIVAETAVSYIPTVHNKQEVELVYEAGVKTAVIQLPTSQSTPPNPQPLIPNPYSLTPSPQPLAPKNLNLILEGTFTPKQATQYARLGASAIIVHDTIYKDDDQLMADLITQARRMQRAWDAGCDGDGVIE